MKKSLITMLALVLVSMSAHASAKSENTAAIVARGVYAQMDRALKAQDPNAKVPASANCGSSDVNAAVDAAMNFGRGVYSQMDRATLQKNPKARISYTFREPKASQTGNEIFDIIRFSDDGPSCSIIVWMTNGIPSLESNIYCDTK
jgi:hypothetical protein